MNLTLAIALAAALGASPAARPKLSRKAHSSTAWTGSCTAWIAGRDDRYTYLLTAAHCTARPGTTLTLHDETRRWGARVIAQDKASDLALLATWPRKTGSPLPTTDKPATRDAIVYGRGPEGNLHAISLHWTGTSPREPWVRAANAWAVTQGKIVGGDSGSPVFDELGRVAGVVTHTTTTASRHPRQTVLTTRATDLAGFVETECDNCLTPDHRRPRSEYELEFGGRHYHGQRSRSWTDTHVLLAFLAGVAAVLAYHHLRQPPPPPHAKS